MTSPTRPRVPTSSHGTNVGATQRFPRALIDPYVTGEFPAQVDPWGPHVATAAGKVLLVRIGGTGGPTKFVYLDSHHNPPRDVPGREVNFWGEIQPEPLLSHSHDNWTLDVVSYPWAPPSFSPVRSAMAEVGKLAALRENWDGYGSPPIHPTSIAAAIYFLGSPRLRAANAPDVVPTSPGNAQLEWHRSTEHVEVQFWPDGLYNAVYRGVGGYEEWEADARGDVPNDLAIRIVGASAR